MKCSWYGKCERDRETDGFCDPHYRIMLKLRGGKVDTAEVLEHLARLRELGWTYRQIENEAAIGVNAAYKLVTSGWQRSRRRTVDAILAIPLQPRDSTRSVSVLGTKRRVQSLMWMGWSKEATANAAGVCPTTLRKALLRPTVTYAFAHAVARAYDRISNTEGPSVSAKRWARHLGYVAPMAWEYVDIDDPKAKPFQGFHKESA